MACAPPPLPRPAHTITSASKLTSQAEGRGSNGNNSRHVPSPLSSMPQAGRPSPLDEDGPVPQSPVSPTAPAMSSPRKRQKSPPPAEFRSNGTSHSHVSGSRPNSRQQSLHRIAPDSPPQPPPRPMPEPSRSRTSSISSTHRRPSLGKRAPSRDSSSRRSQTSQSSERQASMTRRSAASHPSSSSSSDVPPQPPPRPPTETTVQSSGKGSRQSSLVRHSGQPESIPRPLEQQQTTSSSRSAHSKERSLRRNNSESPPEPPPRPGVDISLKPLTTSSGGSRENGLAGAPPPHSASGNGVLPEQASLNSASESSPRSDLPSDDEDVSSTQPPAQQPRFPPDQSLASPGPNKQMSCPFPPVPPPRPQTNDPPLPPLPEPPLPPLPMPPESQVCPVEPEVRGGGSSSSMMSNTYAASASSSAHQTDTQQRNHKKQQQQPVVDTQSQVSTATPAHRLSQTRRNNNEERSEPKVLILSTPESRRAMVEMNESRETPFCPHLLVKRRAAILAIVSSVTLLVITTTTLVLVSALGAKGPGTKSGGREAHNLNISHVTNGVLGARNTSYVTGNATAYPLHIDNSLHVTNNNSASPIDNHDKQGTHPYSDAVYTTTTEEMGMPSNAGTAVNTRVQSDNFNLTHTAASVSVNVTHTTASVSVNLNHTTASVSVNVTHTTASVSVNLNHTTASVSANLNHTTAATTDVHMHRTTTIGAETANSSGTQTDKADRTMEQ